MRCRWLDKADDWQVMTCWCTWWIFFMKCVVWFIFIMYVPCVFVACAFDQHSCYWCRVSFILSTRLVLFFAFWHHTTNAFFYSCYNAFYVVLTYWHYAAKWLLMDWLLCLIYTLSYKQVRHVYFCNNFGKFVVIVMIFTITLCNIMRKK